MPTNWKILLAGGFGGCAPGLFRLGVQLTAGGQMPKAGYILAYTLGLVIFGLIGAGIAAVWGEKDLRKVVYIGIGLPSLLQLTAGELSHAPNSTAAFFPLVGVASAQTRVAASTVAPFRKTMSLHIASGVFARADSIGVRFTNETGSMSEYRKLPLHALDSQIAVPAFAKSVEVSNASLPETKTTVPIGNTPSSVFEVSKETNPWAGFWSAFGFHNVPNYSLGVMAKK